MTPSLSPDLSLFPFSPSLPIPPYWLHPTCTPCCDRGCGYRSDEPGTCFAVILVIVTRYLQVLNPLLSLPFLSSSLPRYPSPSLPALSPLLGLLSPSIYLRQPNSCHLPSAAAFIVYLRCPLLFWVLTFVKITEFQLCILVVR